MSTDYRDGYDKEDFDGDPIDQWFPRRGQCQVCGVPGADQRHRRIEAIADLNHFPHALSISIEVPEPSAARHKPSNNHAGDAPTVALKGIGAGASATATVVDGVITSIAIKTPAGDV